MFVRLLTQLVILTLLPAGCAATTFSFFTTMRAGQPGTASWEIGAGSTSATTQSQQDFYWDASLANPTWRSGNLPQNFQIGYQAATNTGYVTVFNSTGAATTASFTNPGASILANAIWTLPVANFFATANTFLLPGSVNVENLSFSAGVQILSGSLPLSIGASDTGFTAGATNNLAAPIVFNPSSSGGDWTLSGTIRFNGLWPVSGLAIDGQLAFGFGAFGDDTPEASSAVLIGGGLIALGLFGYRKRRSLAGRAGDGA